MAASADCSFDLFEGAEKDLVFTRDAESHVVVVFVTVGESTAGNASYTFANQHLVELDRVSITVGNPGPDIERRARVEDLESNVSQRVDCSFTLGRKLIAQHVVVVRIRHQHFRERELQ